MKEDSLKKLRAEMREKDSELVRLLNERAGIAVRIGRVKQAGGKETYDPVQEGRILDAVREMNGGPLSGEALAAIYREIFSSSRALQAEMKIAYLGPEGSFSQLAAESRFGNCATLLPQASIPEVFDTVERGNAALGIVPLENSLEGSVKAALDRLISTPLQIRAEIFLRVSHCLVSKSPGLKRIRKIYSHPQAIAQCRHWLRMNMPGAELVEMSSTAAAARQAAAEPGCAAIASARAAGLFGVHIVAEAIEDNPLNTTRFVVIGTGKSERSGRDKTSILMGSAHRPGALFHALEPFAAKGLNLLRIESYPVRERNWEYLFFLDFEGHREDGNTAACLRDMEKVTAFIKVLGSYPRGEEP